MKKSMLTLGILTTSLLVVTGCSSASSEEAPSKATLAPPASVTEAGEFKVCANIAYPPYEFFKDGTQEPDGSDIAVARAIGDLWGVPTTHLNVGFEGLIAAVQTEKCQVALSGMSPLPERLEAVSFVVYQQNGTLILVPKGNPEGLDSLESLSGMRVGVMLGSSQAKVLEDFNTELETAGKPPVKITTYSKDTDAPAALISNKLDAYFAAGPSVMQRVKQASDQLEVTGELVNPELLAVTVRKDDAEMLEGLSEAIKELYANGTMTQILEEWDMDKESLPADQQGEIVE
ncbi:ABC transporter substrate-binding protein [Leucobacter sp. gxy201]|uniref:ABC transporter substrate-binding protein n=1 Tax=Leucobacter sp. gxy201 TaxID=2957200 RepID=UPI003DA0D6B7